jgi:hypothetical protein
LVPVVNDVKRQGEAERKEDSDPPRGRVTNAVALGVQENRDRGRTGDRPVE